MPLSKPLNHSLAFRFHLFHQGRSSPAPFLTAAAVEDVNEKEFTIAEWGYKDVKMTMEEGKKRGKEADVAFTGEANDPNDERLWFDGERNGLLVANAYGQCRICGITRSHGVYFPPVCLIDDQPCCGRF